MATRSELSSYMPAGSTLSCSATDKVTGLTSAGDVICGADVDTDTTYSAGFGLSLSAGAFAVDESTVQSRVAGTCSIGNYVTGINQDGSVTCDVDDIGITGAGTVGRVPVFTASRQLGDSAMVQSGSAVSFQGALVPAAGTQGIEFPDNPGGGSGDDAWIRYFAVTGETTTLQIGVANDTVDGLEFYQNGGARLSIRSGVVGLGAPLQLLSSSGSPVACTSAYAGATYYSTALNEPCFCNGSQWQQYDGGGSCP